MKKNKPSQIQKATAATALALILAFGLARPAFAEEYVPPPEAFEEYVPPPEAFEGPGGWAVIDPETGIVYGVIVGDWNEEVWQEVKNTRTIDGFMGCPAPCQLRFQTRATEDGNVAGWHGTQTNIDGDGNATQSNDGSVRWDESSDTFQINNQIGDGETSTQTLVPEKTARDANGQGRSMDLGTGIVDIRTSKRITSGSESASVDTYRSDLSDSTVDADRSESASVDTYRSDLSDSTVDAVIALPGLGSRGTLEYVFGSRGNSASEPVNELGQIRTDLIAILMGMGFTQTVNSVDEETGEEKSTEILDESNAFVITILTVTQGVVNFFSSLLGFINPVTVETSDA
jgi:hypothetical protein